MKIFSFLFLVTPIFFSFSTACAGEEGGGPAITSNNLIEDYKKAYESCTKEAEKAADKKDNYDASYASYFKECIEGRGFQVKDDAVLHDFDTTHLEGPAIGLKPAKKPEKKKEPEGTKEEKVPTKEGDKNTSGEGEKKAEDLEKKSETKDTSPKKEGEEVKKS